ncbi:lipase family protein [Ectopseudomonas mendocina]|uniref:Lipase family protein n=1 Tax=Ectopseudomonas mendocina TaxID=300 RepID=A0ABZ2RI44_ECTME
MTSSSTNNSKTLGCPLLSSWVSFRLVDEYGEGKSYAGLPYKLHDKQGQLFEGNLDNDGFAKVEGFCSGPAVLEIDSLDNGELDPWYKTLAIRKSFALPLTALQVAAEQSPSGPRRSTGKTYLAEQRALREHASFMRVEVSDFVEDTAHLPEADSLWNPKPSASLKQNAGQAKVHGGVALRPNMHHVLEVKALRAYSPLLSRTADFCALNAYHLSVMTAFVYAPFSQTKDEDAAYQSFPPPYTLKGSIGNVLCEQLPGLIKPTLFNGAQYDLLCEEVPYSKRLEVMPYDPERYAEEAAQGWNNPEDVHFLYDEATETQAFITHNDKVVLISVRGTQEDPDKLRDMDARQVPIEMEDGVGQAHRGFYEAFKAAKKFTQRYLDAFYSNDHTIIVCGHSLGGAIALLLAEWVRRQWSENVQLYTFGAPRAADSAFVKAAAALTHHRIVNHNDPVPSVPAPWMDVEWRMLAVGAAFKFTPIVGDALLYGGLVNLAGDPYEHHGKQRHLMPRLPNGGSKLAILWEPGCAELTENICSQYVESLKLDGDMPARDSLLDQALQADEHSSDGGYSRSLLTTLLRWIASIDSRNGRLFTDNELADLQQQAKEIDGALESWTPMQPFAFAKELIKLGLLSPLATADEVNRRYEADLAHARKVSRTQRAGLRQAVDRLLAQAERPLTPADVFGEHAQNPELEKLVSEWRAIDANAKAEYLAKISTTPSKVYA